MTIVVGIEHEDGVTLAADRQGSSQSYARIRQDVKVWKVHQELAIGGWGDNRLLQSLRHTSPPELPIVPRPSMERWLVRNFIDWLRKHLRGNGALKVSDGIEQMTSEAGAGFLIAARGELWEVASDFQVIRTVEPFTAGGSGARYALGALGAMLGGDDPPLSHRDLKPDSRRDLAAKIATNAVAIAARFDNNVGGPTDVVHTR